MTPPYEVLHTDPESRKLVFSPARARALLNLHLADDDFDPAEDRDSANTGPYADLVAVGAARSTGTYFTITPLGRAWVRAMLATPIPRMAFVDANGTVIPE